jgi:competence protein ComEA
MNPFIKDPVAQPLGVYPYESWRMPGKSSRTSALSRKARAAMVAAGLAVGLPAQALDVNVASVTQLESLRGIGPRTAKMIVQERSRAGAFASMEDLSDRVRGLGVRRVRALRQAGLEVRADRAGAHTSGKATALVPDMPDRTGDSKRKNQRQTQPLVAKPEVISPADF